jgi:hypothetical protein
MKASFDAVQGCIFCLNYGLEMPQMLWRIEIRSSSELATVMPIVD